MNRTNKVVVGYIIVVIIALLVVLAISYQEAGASGHDRPYLAEFEPGNVIFVWEDVPPHYCMGRLYFVSFHIEKNGMDEGTVFIPPNFLCEPGLNDFPWVKQTLTWRWDWQPDSPGIYRPGGGVVNGPDRSEIFINPLLFWLEGYIFFLPIVEAK